MTPVEAQRALAEIAAEAGPKSYASIVMSSDRGKAIYITLAIGGLLEKHRISAQADTFEEAIDLLRKGWDDAKHLADKNTIRKMALAIIEITSDQGECSDAALRGAGFHQPQIDRIGSLSCAEATRLAAGGPFSIVSTVGANAEAA